MPKREVDFEPSIYDSQTGLAIAEYVSPETSRMRYEQNSSSFSYTIEPEDIHVYFRENKDKQDGATSLSISFYDPSWNVIDPRRFNETNWGGLFQAGLIPNCISYDPTYAHELAVILQDGMRRMYVDQEDVFYYITLMNENYPHPALPAGSEEGILKGAYLLKDGGDAEVKVQLMGSGTILREVEAAADLLRNDFGIAADVWSVTSFNLLNRDGRETARWNLLHPTETPREAYLTRALAGRSGPFIAATDYIRAYADQVREFVPGRYTVLGTDGFGRSDSRQNLRKFFEVDRHYVVVAALKALADEGKLPAARVAEAMTRYGIDADKPASWLV
jgi:pyruvate dehydrogenase E1 component